MIIVPPWSKEKIPYINKETKRIALRSLYLSRVVVVKVIS